MSTGVDPMEAYRSLLAVVQEKAEPTPAIQRAAELARASGATLHLCSFVHDPAANLAAVRSGDEVARRVQHDILREHEEKLERLTASLAGRGHPVECEVIWAPDPVEAILAKCAIIGPQVVLKDGQHESSVRRIFYTPLDWKLMRLLPCELMLVRPAAAARPKRIAAAVDVWAEGEGADGLNRRIIDTAMQLSEYLDTRLDLVSVFPHFPSLHYRSWPDAEAMIAKENNTHYEAFAKLTESYSIPEERRHRPTGAPSETLNRFVTENRIDILVLGSIYQTSWERLLLGSTAETLAQQIDADLVLVRPENFSKVLRKIVNMDELAELYAA
jgi:universal stress protein E